MRHWFLRVLEFRDWRAHCGMKLNWEVRSEYSGRRNKLKRIRPPEIKKNLEKRNPHKFVVLELTQDEIRGDDLSNPWRNHWESVKGKRDKFGRKNA